MNWTLLLQSLPSIIVAIGFGLFFYSQWRKNGEITLQDLRDATEIGVKAAEQLYIKSNGETVRVSDALSIVQKMLHIDFLTPALIEEVMSIIPAILNGMPKTTPQLKKAKTKTGGE